MYKQLYCFDLECHTVTHSQTLCLKVPFEGLFLDTCTLKVCCYHDCVCFFFHNVLRLRPDQQQSCYLADGVGHSELNLSRTNFSYIRVFFACRQTFWLRQGTQLDVALEGNLFLGINQQLIVPLNNPVTRYKNASCTVRLPKQRHLKVYLYKVLSIDLEVPLCNLPLSMCNFVPCDQIMQRPIPSHYI